MADRKKPRPVSGFFHSTPKVAAFGAEMTATPDYIPSNTIVAQMGHKSTAIGYYLQGWLRDPGRIDAPGMMAEPLFSMRSKERDMPLELSWGAVISITFVVALLMVAVSAYIAYHRNGV